MRWLFVVVVTLTLSWVALGHTGPSGDTAPIIELVPFADYPGAVKCLISGCSGSPTAAKLLLNDGFGNVVVFIPFGVGIGLAVAANTSPHHSPVKFATIAGFGLSVCFEIAQLFIPGRVVGIGDLITNSLGAWIGGLLAARISLASERLSE